MAAPSQDAAPLPRPGPIGRGLRLVLGLAVLYLFADIVADFPKLTDGVNLANPLTWVGLGFALYAAPGIVRMVLSRQWSAWRVRGAVAGALVLAVSTDFFVTGSPNGGAFGVTFGLVLALVLGVLGASFLVAAAVASPG